MERIKKTIYIAIFVSLAAQISFEFFTAGFIIGMSVMVMAIFIYCYEDLSPTYIAFSSGIFSPLFRLLIMFIKGGEFQHLASLALPDMVFFFSYGIFYPIFYSIIVRDKKTLRNFPYVIFGCEVLSNIGELIARSYLAGTNLIDAKTVAYLIMITIVRTAIVQMILIAMDAYSSLLVKRENEEEYRRLLVMSSLLESELHIMKKNAGEIEDIMKSAFELYKSIESIEAPKEFIQKSLDIAQNAHEVKGDYLGIVKSLQGSFMDDYDNLPMSMKDIVNLEKSAIDNINNDAGRNVEISVKIREDFYVKEYFKMMAVIRNLLINGAEAIEGNRGKVALSITSNQSSYILTVRDNGRGIDEETIKSMFLPGFSTKFNPGTGNIQRGIGLTTVKDYIENFFHGSIEVTSKKGEFTLFTIRLPKEIFQEAFQEV